jgi:hypothetical protein
MTVPLPLQGIEVRCSVCGRTTTVFRSPGNNDEFGNITLFALSGCINNLYFRPDDCFCDIECCEHCHYVNTDITKKLYDKVNTVIQDPEYQDIFKSNCDDFGAHEWVAFLYLLDNCDDDTFTEERLTEIYSIAYLQLLDAINQVLDTDVTTTEQLHLEKIKSEYTLRFLQHLQKSQNLIDKLRLVELYRRNGDFTKASETIAEIENKKESIFGVLKKQKELVSNKDSRDDGFPYRIY